MNFWMLLMTCQDRLYLSCDLNAVKESVNFMDVVTVTPVVMTSQSLVRRGLANLLR